MSGGLNALNFRKIAPGGLGDPHNSYPHAMTWFGDHLYVTTTRDNLVILKMRSPFEIPLEVWPVSLPRDLWDLDLRAQIWRYDPRDGSWRNVFTSPMANGRQGAEVPLSIAFRTIAVFQGSSDRAPALYAPTFAPSKLSGSVMLRSADGLSFDIVSEPGLGVPGWSFRSFRTLVPFKGRLFTAPTMGAERGKPNMAGAALVLASDDPASGRWDIVNEPNFGDPANRSVFEMTVFNNHLYASTLNVQTGLQVWKTDAEGQPPYVWTQVLTHGAWRGKLNEAAVTMAPFNGDLYLGAAIQNGGYDRIHNIGPAAPELLRIHPDDSWDLIAGDPRVTPDGVRVPLSGMGPGFNNPFAGYFWHMCEHDGWLYLGTFDSLVFLEYATLPERPAGPPPIFKMISLEKLLSRCAGFDLWRSRDGLRWTPVSRNGFGNRFNYGVRTGLSTPHGLFVGTTNPFGPDVAVRHEGGWTYEPNPHGGLEIWLGKAGSVEGEPGHRASYQLDDGLMEEPPETGPDETEDARDAAAERWVDLYYGDSGFRGFGYWHEGIGTASAACEALVDELLSLLPSHEGTLLEVDSGRGAATRAILKRHEPSSLTGACCERSELKACRGGVPRVRFRRARWPRLPFPDASFDSALCIDAPALRGDRFAVQREIRRVLSPGGHLVIADILSADPGSGPLDRKRPGDTTESPEAYAALLARAGFEEVRVLDRTFECWTSFRKNLSNFLLTRLLSGLIDIDMVQRIMKRLPGAGGAVDGYVLAVARVPTDGVRHRQGTP